MRHTILAVSVASLMSAASLLALPALARADEHQEQVSMGGETLLNLRGDSEQAVGDRANRIYERLSYILGDPALRANDVRMVWIDGECAIFVKNRLLVTVTTDDAQRNDTTISNLSDAWIANLRHTLLKVNVPSERIQRVSWIGPTWRLGRSQ